YFYCGRILYLDEVNRFQCIHVTIICSIAQLQVTLYAGLLSIISLQRMPTVFFSSQKYQAIFSNLLLYVTASGGILLTFIYFRIGWFIKRLHRWRGGQRLIHFVEVIELINATILLRILSISVFRYFVFVLQYYLVFRAFDVLV